MWIVVTSSAAKLGKKCSPTETTYDQHKYNKNTSFVIFFE